VEVDASLRLVLLLNVIPATVKHYVKQMSKKVPIKKQAGRPAVLGDAATFIGVRLPGVLVGQIDAWATTASVSRSEALRQLIEAGLKRPPKVKAKD